jgi:hypothetical protein
MITPFKKPEGGELLDRQKEFNKQVKQDPLLIRADHRELQDLADHAHRLLPTPPATFSGTISAVVVLHFYATA